MPLLQPIQHADITISLWKITEAEDELIKRLGFTPDMPSNPNRRLERLATLVLLKSTGFAPYYRYDEQNRPNLFGSTFKISVSHTSGLAAVAFSSDQEVGVDVESVNRNFYGVAGKYLSAREACHSNLYRPEHFALIWTAKEAIYKLPWGRSLVFGRDIEVLLEPECLSRGWLFSRVFDGERWLNLKVFFTFMGEYCITSVGMNHTVKWE